MGNKRAVVGGSVRRWRHWPTLAPFSVQIDSSSQCQTIHPTLMTPEAADQGSPVGKACPALAAVDGLCSVVAPALRQNTHHRNSATPSLLLRDTEKGHEQEQGVSAACRGFCPSPHVGERILPHPRVSLPSSFFSGLEIQWMAPLN